MPNFTLKTTTGSNVITSDPDRPTRRLYHEGGVHRCLSGRRVHDILGIHYDFTLEWNEMTAAQYEALRELYYSGVKLYLDNGNVPPLTETALFNAGATYTYAGITNPSSTHIAYKDWSASFPSAVGDFETTELTTTAYGKIDGDDIWWTHIQPDGGEDKYGYFKFTFESGLTRADIAKLTFRVRARSHDRASPPWWMGHGFIVYGWDSEDEQWVVLIVVSDDQESDVSREYTDGEIARRFIDSGDNYARFLIKTHSFGLFGQLQWLVCWYVELKLDIRTTITLSHTPILDGNDDVIWVKNLTQATTLVLDTDYTISGNEITVAGQTAQDEIEVKYNRYHEVKCDNISEEWIRGDPGSARHRAATVRLSTIRQGVKNS